MEKVLQKINEMKREYNLTDKQIAAILGIADSTIRRWRIGYQIPDWVEKAMDTLERHSKSAFKRIMKDRLK
jgi:DNA-binding transcriptional regulator YiaG